MYYDEQTLIYNEIEYLTEPFRCIPSTSHTHELLITASLTFSITSLLRLSCVYGWELKMYNMFLNKVVPASNLSIIIIINKL